ncbi:MAG: hypothetical protein ABSH06_03750 [Thermodesulfobacteriota bacterium]
MKNNGLSHDVFLDRFAAVAEERLGIRRTKRGFKRAIKIALDVEKDSTVHRWFENSFPSAGYLVKISVVFTLRDVHKIINMSWITCNGRLTTAQTQS